MKMQELTFDEMVNTNGGAGLSGLLNLNIKLTTTSNGNTQSTEINAGLGTVVDALSDLGLGSLNLGNLLSGLNLGGLLGGL
ncbi:hypothetical protein SAMN05421788_101873 [Filimonas lacunae]|uniref:Uncharacterized protein n=1 Tax=Filimonas lacunae TaxID=477680 RepID=A0A173MPP5_9BACT|nr:hypothetical protein [Filimonas lacunae]BAV09437.1 hypothetical protein FLA_5486 [Filimonas lacunae]SIS73136.1 hypothetical protein SAMN05421788_101873 [Filimonas lacunae]